MKWLVLSSKVKTARPRIKMNSSVKKRKKAPAPRKTARPARPKLPLRFAPVVLLLGGIVAAVWLGFTNSACFTLREIRVTNNHSYSPEEVIEMAKAETGGNIFQLDTGLLRSNLLENVNIREAFVQRIFPDTIKIAVSEREPRARVKFGKIYTIDDWGVVLRERKEESGGRLPVVVGLKVKNGSLYPREDREDCLALLRELDQQEIDSLIEIDEIYVADSGVIRMKTAGDLEITIGRDDYSDQLGRLKVVLNNLQESSAPARSVDLRYKHIPVVFDD